jgi:transcription initiation factor IIE alpha subunit
MSKEVISAISHSYELATYSTPELRGLFNDWLGEIEHEVLEFLNERNKVDPDEVAQHFRLKRESVIFILSKLAREGKITMQASGA